MSTAPPKPMANMYPPATHRPTRDKRRKANRTAADARDRARPAEQATAILRNCRRAMAENGRLLLIEAAIPSGNEPLFHKFMDLNMMVMTGGRERTGAEYRALLTAAGFKQTRIIPTSSELCVIEAVRL